MKILCLLSLIVAAALAGCATTPAGPKVSPSEVRVYFHKPDGAAVIGKMRFEPHMDFDEMRSAVAARGGNGLLLLPPKKKKMCGPPNQIPRCIMTLDPRTIQLLALRLPDEAPGDGVTANTAADDDDLKRYSYHATAFVAPRPQYPRGAALHCMEGSVTLGFMLTADGRPSHIVVLKSTPKGVFDDNAVLALRSSTMVPKMIDHKPVAAQARYRYLFKMPFCPPGWGGHGNGR